MRSECSSEGRGCRERHLCCPGGTDGLAIATDKLKVWASSINLLLLAGWKVGEDNTAEILWQHGSELPKGWLEWASPGRQGQWLLKTSPSNLKLALLSASRKLIVFDLKARSQQCMTYRFAPAPFTLAASTTEPTHCRLMCPDLPVGHQALHHTMLRMHIVP